MIEPLDSAEEWPEIVRTQARTPASVLDVEPLVGVEREDSAAPGPIPCILPGR